MQGLLFVYKTNRRDGPYAHPSSVKQLYQMDGRITAARSSSNVPPFNIGLVI